MGGLTIRRCAGALASLVLALATSAARADCTLLVDADTKQVLREDGSASPQGPDGEPDRTRAIGWAEKDGRRVVFVRQTRDETEQDTPAGLWAREAFSKALPELLAAVSSSSGGAAEGREPARECVRKMIPLVCDPDRTDASGRRVPGACRCGPEMCME